MRPAMTRRGLQRLLLIPDNKVAGQGGKTDATATVVPLASGLGGEIKN